MNDASQTGADLARHEAVCAERYANLRADIANLKDSHAQIWSRIWLFIGAIMSIETAAVGWAMAKIIDR